MRPGHGRTFLLWQKPRAEFSIPTTHHQCQHELRRTHHFIELWNFRDAGAENSHTQHMILRRIAATAPAVQRHVWDWVLSPLGVHVGKYCRGTRPARIEPFFHGGCRWAAVARCLAACALLL